MRRPIPEIFNKQFFFVAKTRNNLREFPPDGIRTNQPVVGRQTEWKWNQKNSYSVQRWLVVVIVRPELCLLTQIFGYLMNKFTEKQWIIKIALNFWIFHHNSIAKHYRNVWGKVESGLELFCQENTRVFFFRRGKPSKFKGIPKINWVFSQWQIFISIITSTPV